MERTPSHNSDPLRALETQLAELRARLAREIAERKQAEEAGRRWAAIIQSSDDAIIGKTLDGVIVGWNAAAQRMFGYTAEEAKGQPIDLLIPPDLSHSTGGILAKICQGEHFQHYETVRIHKDGRRVDVSLGISPIKDSGGQVIGISTIARDITERKRQERRLAAQHKVTAILAEFTRMEDVAPRVLRALCEGLGWSIGALWCVDPQGPVLRRLQVWPVPASRGNGQAAPPPVARGEGLVGRAWASGKAVRETNGPRGLLGFPILLGRDIVGVLEFQAPEMDEPDDRLRALLSAVGSQVGQFIDRKRTEAVLQQTEDQFRQAQKMEAIGRLAGGLAHDFNNLLTAITGYSDLILTDLEPDSDLYKQVREIRKASDRAGLLTRQLLAFSRKQVLAPRVLDLNAVIADSKQMLRRMIGEDIDVVTELAADLGRVKADAGQLEQVLMNLAVNARDAMPQGGTLTLATANADLEAPTNPEIDPGRYVVLTVRDTGTGMDAETRAHIFEPFFTTKGPGRGTGLGLATVYGIIEQSCGHIEVESTLGQGTAFCVYLPRTDEVVQTKKSHPGLHQAPVGQETVLLVEDEGAVRALAGDILRKCGYTVLEASQGEEALGIAQGFAGPIHLLVSDVVMPRMGGRQLAQCLAASRPEMRVLYLSGYTDDAVVRHGVLEDEVAFLQKPFSPRVLAHKVREVLDGE